MLAFRLQLNRFFSFYQHTDRVRRRFYSNALYKSSAYLLSYLSTYLHTNKSRENYRIKMIFAFWMLDLVALTVYCKPISFYRANLSISIAVLSS